jgi:serine/threonine protein phosphatase PrpC
LGGFLVKAFFKNTIEKFLGAPPQDQSTNSQPTMESSPTEDTAATAPLSKESLADLDKQVYPPQMIVGCAHSVGLQRDHNEDSLFVLNTNMISDSSSVPFGLFIVADGMGGHQHGEIASGVSIRAMVSYLLQKLYLPLYSLSPEPPEESLYELLQQGIYEAHKSILKAAAGGGTTITAALVFSSQLIISHVGDSRAYAIFPDKRTQVITRDHSLVKRLEELGQITSAEAAVHPQRNVLYRALGQGEPFEPDVISFPIPKGGYLMLCSDGLWGVVPENELVETVVSTASPTEACKKLVDAANKAGGPDNITVVLVRMPE